MARALVFLDIDGTLLDENYTCNDDSITDTIQRLQSEGVVFCLNSNRALEDLLPIAKQFSINGLLIGENGLFIYNVAEKTTTSLVSQSQTEHFAEAKTEFEALAKKLILEQYGPDTTWFDVDTVKALHEAPDERIKEGSVVALNNQFRRYTSSLHLLKRYHDRLLHLPAEELSRLTEQLRNTFDHAEDFTITHSTNFSNILFYTTSVSKQSGAEQAVKMLGEPEQVYAIGDELDDFTGIAKLGTFLTVANASPETQAKGQNVAQAKYALGVHENLAYIEAHLRK